jgi:peptide deformylase
MPVKPIRELGDPILREVSAPITDPASAQDLFKDLRDTLHEFRRRNGFGRGISAVQIGEIRRAIYMEVDGRDYALINPEYVWQSPQTFELWDDCFSFPDLLVRLRRATAVQLRYVDGAGAVRTLSAQGALSELVQHEMDHLDGILAVDRALGPAALCTRAEWQRRYSSGMSAPAPPAESVQASFT